MKGEVDREPSPASVVPLYPTPSVLRGTARPADDQLFWVKRSKVRRGGRFSEECGGAGLLGHRVVFGRWVRKRRDFL